MREVGATAGACRRKSEIWNKGKEVTTYMSLIPKKMENWVDEGFQSTVEFLGSEKYSRNRFTCEEDREER